jgi:hypothetical protein
LEARDGVAPLAGTAPATGVTTTQMVKIGIDNHRPTVCGQALALIDPTPCPSPDVGSGFVDPIAAIPKASTRRSQSSCLVAPATMCRVGTKSLEWIG